MFTHDDIWRAIDRLAEEKGFSASGLARSAGLDPTAFNRSKRTSPNGKPRWPSTESLAKILAITGCGMEEFLFLMRGQGVPPPADPPGPSVPVVSYTQIRTGVIHTPHTTPQNHIDLPSGIRMNTPNAAFATTLDDGELAPLYRRGSVLVADTGAKAAPDDRVLLFSRSGGLTGGIVHATQKNSLTLLLPQRGFHETSFAGDDIEWVARILWASQ